MSEGRDEAPMSAEESAQVGTWQIDLGTGRTTWSDGVAGLLGVAPEVGERDVRRVIDVVHPGDRERAVEFLRMIEDHRELIPRRGLEASFRVVREGDSVREIQVHGRVVPAAGDGPPRWLAVLRDVTHQRLAERELAARSAITLCLTEARSLRAAALDILERLGTTLDYDAGSLWHPSDEHADAAVLACASTWSAPHADAAAFERVERTLTFRKGEGLPGRAWRSARPVIVKDLGLGSVFHPGFESGRRSLRSAVAFPVTGEASPLGVIALYRLEEATHSETLGETLAAIGSEIGHRVERGAGRRRAGAALSGRELEVLRLLVDGCSNVEIAEGLVLSPATVKTHLEHIYAKLGVRDRVGAVAHALRNGIVE
jgi:DNA-binding CsgD family transcriptional regulator